MASQVTADILSNNGEDTEKRPKKLPTNINWEAYATTASRDLETVKEALSNVEEFTQGTVDKVIYDLNEIITKSANACKLEEIAVETTPELYDGNRSIQQIIKDISAKEIKSWNEILNNKNPKDLWNKISWKDSTSEKETKYPTAEALGEHFQQKALIQNEIPFAFTEGTNVPVLGRNPLKY